MSASSVVVFVTADPRESGKANEALREGLGFNASQLEVRFLLAREATRLVSDDPLDFVDSDAAEKNLGYYKKWKTPFLLLNAPVPDGCEFNAKTVDPAAAALLVADAGRLVRF